MLTLQSACLWMPDFLTGQNEKNQWIRTRISNLIIHERNRSFDFKTVEQCYLRFYLLRIEISLGWATLCHFSNGHVQTARWSPSQYPLYVNQRFLSGTCVIHQKKRNTKKLLISRERECLSVRKTRRDFPHELSQGFFLVFIRLLGALLVLLPEFQLISLEEANKIKWKTQQKDPTRRRRGYQHLLCQHRWPTNLLVKLFQSQALGDFLYANFMSWGSVYLAVKSPWKLDSQKLFDGLKTLQQYLSTAVLTKITMIYHNLGNGIKEGKKKGGNYSADFDLIGILDEIPFALSLLSLQKKSRLLHNFDLLGELIIV